MRRCATVAGALLIAAAPALGETDTPVTLDRQVGPEVGEEMRIYVADPGDGPLHLDGTIRPSPVEVRVRAVSGLPLTAEEQEEVRPVAVLCDGAAHAENLSERLEPDDTMVLTFDCVRLE